MARGYLVAVDQALATILVAAVLAGVGQSALHATFQRWATEAAPQAPGVTASFATGALGGAALAALVGEVIPREFTVLFVIASICSVVTGLIGAIHRRAAPYRRRSRLAHVG